MISRGRWLRAAVVLVLLTLVLGRFLAVASTDQWWAEALGVVETHAVIARLKTLLLAAAFLSALVWCVGNFYFVYRSIGSLSVPRRLGNLEIFEALPRKYLLIATIIFGILLAVALSHRAGSWWYAHALAQQRISLGITDPIIGRDASFYLFSLPWQRTLHSHVTVLVAVVLGIVAVLYAAFGAVRLHQRRIQVSTLARRHLGVLLVALSLVLLWGYRLEPVEYVGGIHGVPLDDVLVSVRLPAARLLGALALIAGAGSLLWLWVPHPGLVAGPWVFLAVVSFFGHYVVPAFSGSVRSPQELLLPGVEAARPRHVELAFAADPIEVSLDVPTAPEPAALRRYERALRSGPLWDAFAVQVFLDRVASGPPRAGFSDVHLSVYREPDGLRIPVYVAVRRFDFGALRNDGAELSWERVHGAPYGFTRGAIAVVANHVSERGHPVFVPDLARPSSTVTDPVELHLERPDILFAPGTSEYVVLPTNDTRVAGVRAGGLARRLALAWTLQSPKLLTSDAVSDTTLVVWDRAVVSRLERYAPFARFADPYAVVVDRKLYWLVHGYVSAQAVPVAPRIEWRGESVGFLRSGLIGVVEAWSGKTTVYILRDADPISRAWAQLTPALVRPLDELPGALRAHLRYPRTLFAVQREVLRHSRLRDVMGADPEVRVGARIPATARFDGFWWVGATPIDTVSRMRLAGAFEMGDPPLLAAVADGSVVDGRLTLTLMRLREPFDVEGPSMLPRRLALQRPPGLDGVDGTVRTLVLEEGALRIQPLYGGGTDGFDEAPHVLEIGLAWGNLVGRGADLPEALRNLERATGGVDLTAPRWSEARRWFHVLDSARIVGDWRTFGRAYETLKRLLGAGRDTTP